MSLFRELRRRNVFRVGIAYAVAGWLILQLTEVLSELLNLPEEVGPVVVAIVAIGFPLALFFAWAFELTPEGIKREHEVDRTQSITPKTGQKLNVAIILLLVVAVGYLLFDKFSGDRPESASTPAAEATEVAEATEAASVPDSEPADERPSIAVIPFVNRSRLEEDEFFVDGVHDDLLTNLARIGSLKVISRTSVLRYRDTETPIPEIAEELGVTTIMEGAVQRSGDTVRINVQLIDAATDEHLWAEIYDREMTAENLFAIQSEISRAIADALQATLTPEEQQRMDQRPTENLAAYNAYLRGRQEMAKRTNEGLQAAKLEFERATELDPEFALAWVGLADSNALLYAYGTLSIDDVVEFSEPALERAIALDPAMGEAYTTLGSIRAMQERFDEAEAAYIKGTELSPNYATAWHWYSNYLRRLPGRLNEARVMAEKALELDPLSSIIRTNLAGIYRAMGDDSAAEVRLQEIIDLDPEFPQTYNMLAGLNLDRTRYDEALRWALESLHIDPENIGALGVQFRILMEVGSSERALAVLEKMEELDATHETTYFANLNRLLSAGNTAGILELANQFPLTESAPGTRYLKGMMFAFAERYEEARALVVYPGADYENREDWDQLMQLYGVDACDVAWIYLNTGDEKLARDLVDRTIRYVEDELTQYVDGVTNQSLATCHATVGNTAAAVADLQQQVDSNRPLAVRYLRMFPAFKSMQADPEFVAIINDFEDKAHAQREAVERRYDEFHGAGP